MSQDSWEELVLLEGDLGDEAGTRLQPAPEPDVWNLAIVWHACRRRWRSVVGVALATVLLGTVGVAKKLKPSFRAEATIHVRPTAPSLAYTGEEWRAQSIEGFYGDYVRTLKASATRAELLERVLATLDQQGVAWLPEGVPHEEAAAHLRARLDVQHLRDSYLLSIGLEDAAAEIPAPVVNAIAEALIEDENAIPRRDAEGRLAILHEEKERVQEELLQTQRDLDDLSRGVGVAILDESQNVFYERLIRLQDGVTKVYLERVRAEADFDRELARSAVLRDELAAGECLRLLDEDVAVRDARLMFQRLLSDVENETGDLGEEHPARVQAVLRVEAARERLVELELATLERIQHRKTVENTELADRLEREARGRLNAARKGEEEIVAVVRSVEQQLEDYSSAVEKGKGLRAEGARHLAAIERIDGKIEELVVESKAPGRLSFFARGVDPTKPASDRRRIALVLLACFAAGAGAAVATVLDVYALWKDRQGAQEPQA